MARRETQSGGLGTKGRSQFLLGWVGGGGGGGVARGWKVRDNKYGEKEKEHSNLLSPILKVSFVGIHRAKSESSSTRRGLRVGTKKEGFP